MWQPYVVDAWPRAGRRGDRTVRRVDNQWAAEVVHTLEEAERDPASIMITPFVLEIIATKR